VLPDEMLEALPHRQVVVVLRVPIVVEFITRKDADLAGGAFDPACLTLSTEIPRARARLSATP
jgi:hypothetical protein